MKKIFALVLAVVAVFSAAQAFAADVPTLRVAYSLSTHHEPFMVAMARGDKFKDYGVWLEPVVAKEKFDLYADGKKIARLNVVVSKNSAETTSLFAQKHLDLCVNSFPAMLTGIDRGTPIKVLAPMQADAIAMVARNDINVKGWDAFQEYVKKSKRPVLVGYHSPTSAPKIVFEGAMDKVGLRLTGDANATKEDADILMVDLKNQANVIPSMVANQVEFAVVPAPTPEVIEAKKQGHVVLQMKELPPKGEWESFPCCCVAGLEDVVKQYPEAVGNYVRLITAASDWCQKNKKDGASIAADWLGIDGKIIENSEIEFSTKVTPTWFKNAERYPDMLNRLGQLSGALKDKKLADVSGLVFDFSFTEVEK